MVASAVAYIPSHCVTLFECTIRKVAKSHLAVRVCVLYYRSRFCMHSIDNGSQYHVHTAHKYMDFENRVHTSIHTYIHSRRDTVHNICTFSGTIDVLTTYLLTPNVATLILTFLCRRICRMSVINGDSGIHSLKSASTEMVKIIWPVPPAPADSHPYLWKMRMWLWWLSFHTHEFYIGMMQFGAKTMTKKNFPKCIHLCISVRCTFSEGMHKLSLAECCSNRCQPSIWDPRDACMVMCTCADNMHGPGHECRGFVDSHAAHHLVHGACMHMHEWVSPFILQPIRKRSGTQKDAWY